MLTCISMLVTARGRTDPKGRLFRKKPPRQSNQESARTVETSSQVAHTCVLLLMTSISCRVTTCTTSLRFCNSPSGHCTNLVDGPGHRATQSRKHQMQKHSATELADSTGKRQHDVTSTINCCAASTKAVHKGKLLMATKTQSRYMA